MIRNIGVFISLIGAAFLLIASIGHWTAIGKYENAPPRQWERFDPTLENALNSIPKLIEATKNKLPANPSDREVMDASYNIIAERFTHKRATHTLFSNWLLYFAGSVHTAFLHIWDPNLLMAKGHSLFCDQSSYILLNVALANGIKARHVGLGGHVVMEAWYNDDWHLYDPDLEVLPVDDSGQVLSVEKLASNKELLNKYYGNFNIAHIVGSRGDNTYMSIPEGARFEWKSNVLVYVEKTMEVLKFILPILFMITGIWLFMRPTKIRL